MNNTEFFKKCENHDWYYRMSDDNRAYKAGEESSRKLEEESKQSTAYKKIYKSWLNYMFNNGPKPTGT